MLLRFFLFLSGTALFFACQDTSKEAVTADSPRAKDRANVVEESDSGMPEVAVNLQLEEQMYAWRQTQDSLREVILGRKTNTKLKTGLFEELYIRDIIREEKDTLYFDIDFDRHEYMGCMAPDGYTTSIRFQFYVGENLQFPNVISFTEHERGSSVPESKISGEFQREELSRDYVTYYSAEHKRTLIIDEGGVYYFVGTAMKEISGFNLSEMLSVSDESTPQSKLPYQTTRRICAYEDLLN